MAVINEPEEGVDAEKSKSSFVEITREGSPHILDVPNSQFQLSNVTAGPTEHSQRPSDLSKEEIPVQILASSQEQATTMNLEGDDEKLETDDKIFDRGLSGEGTVGSSAARPLDDSQINDMIILDSGAGRGGSSAPGNFSAAVQTSAGPNAHPIENSRQKWELAGAEEGDLGVRDEESGGGAVAIAPMRLSMTNESELEIASSNDNTITGNDDSKMGLQPAAYPAVHEQPEYSYGNPNEVGTEKVKTPLRGPSKSPTPHLYMNSGIVSGMSDDENLSGQDKTLEEDQGKTYNMEGDGTSVDENASGPRPEYVCNIEDSRPPWVIEAHTLLPNSKTQKTPRIVKSYNEDVAIGGALQEERDAGTPINALPEVTEAEGNFIEFSREL